MQFNLHEIFMNSDGHKYMIEGTFHDGEADMESLIDETDRISVPLVELQNQWTRCTYFPNENAVAFAIVRYGGEAVTHLGLAFLAGDKKLRREIQDMSPARWEKYYLKAQIDGPKAARMPTTKYLTEEEGVE